MYQEKFVDIYGEAHLALASKVAVGGGLIGAAAAVGAAVAAKKYLF